MSTLISSNKPKARTEHKCSYCDGVIKRGETYIKQSVVFDGRMYSWKSHFRCNAIAIKLNMFDDCDEGVTQYDFWEIVEEEYRYLWEELHPLTFESDPIPKFLEQLDFVCNYHSINNYSKKLNSSKTAQS
jgi:hypothetical protein